MKYFAIIVLAVIGFIPSSYGQITDTIDVCFDKSVYLIFDGDVTTDFGSQESIIVREANNKVIVQAAVEGFYETNLLVQVGSQLYMFIVRYNDNPKKLLWNYQKGVTKSVQAGKTGSGQTEEKQNGSNDNGSSELTDYKIEKELTAEQRKQDSLKQYFSPLLDKMNNLSQEIYNRGKIEGKMKFILTNLRIDNDVYFFKLRIINNSKIKYDMDYVDFRVVDKKSATRKNVEQELRLEPLYVDTDSLTVLGKNTLDVIYVVPKFVLNEDKKLDIVIWENNGGLETEGGRRINFSLYAEDIINVKGI